MTWAILPLRRAFDFRGRSRRAEFWTFVVLAQALFIAARLVDEALGHHSPRIDAQGYERSVAGPVLAVVTLALLLPGLAVTVRRLHDIDRRGSWILLPLAPPFVILPLMELFEWMGLVLIGLLSGAGLLTMLIFLCLPGTPGPNRFGPPQRTGRQPSA